MTKKVEVKKTKQPAVSKRNQNLLLVSMAIFLVVFSFVWLKTGFSQNQQQVLGTKNIVGDQQLVTSDQQLITDWEKIVKLYPNYRDGWLQLAVRYNQVGDKEKALNALEKAREIDPNNETVKSLEKIIQK